MRYRSAPAGAVTMLCKWCRGLRCELCMSWADRWGYALICRPLEISVLMTGSAEADLRLCVRIQWLGESGNAAARLDEEISYRNAIQSNFNDHLPNLLCEMHFFLSHPHFHSVIQLESLFLHPRSASSRCFIRHHICSWSYYSFVQFGFIRTR